MIPEQVVDDINEIVNNFHTAIERLRESESVRFLIRSSPAFKDQLDSIGRVAQRPQLQRRCEARITCAVIGSSGHGKTTLLDEMFPALSASGWLVTDVTDTTSQSLRIGYAAADSTELHRVEIRSSTADEIAALFRHPEVEEQNQKENIDISYQADGIIVDGSRSTFDTKDEGGLKFPRIMGLVPFGEDYVIEDARACDARFIRAVTVKEQSDVIDTGTILSQGGRDYNALQLRAVVKDIALRDPFDRIRSLSGIPESSLGSLVFLDTPGLSVSSSTKDEVLRHCLGRKSEHIALQLWKNDELDVIIHLVLCGRSSDFAGLWKTVERECGPAAMSDLSHRLVLAINGTNKYFTDLNIAKKYEDPATAKREGDQFASTLKDNILQKMSPRGFMKPARICFLDSKKIVEKQTSRSYADAYTDYQEVMGRWIDPGGIGYDTLAELGLLDAFRRNIEALADPEDRGQGHLIRELIGLIEETGPALLLRKYLVKTELVKALQRLNDLLTGFYDSNGAVRQAALQKAVVEALRGCLPNADGDDESVEVFARNHFDPAISEFIEGLDVRGLVEDGWVRDAYDNTSTLVRDILREASSMQGELAVRFEELFDHLAAGWRQQWGYAGAVLDPPTRGRRTNAYLMCYCLQMHAREMLHQILRSFAEGGDGAAVLQSDDDKAGIRLVLANVANAVDRTTEVCSRHGVAVS